MRPFTTSIEWTTGIIVIEPGRHERNYLEVASLLEVGTGFHPELTGRENIYLNSAILSMSCVEVHRKFDEIVAFAKVEKFPETWGSSGIYMRLAFAVAAHLREVSGKSMMSPDWKAERCRWSAIIWRRSRNGR